MLVVGGTLAATMIAYQGRYVFRTLKSLFSIIAPFKLNPKALFKDIERVITFSDIAKREGALNISNSLSDKEKKTPF